MPIPVFTFTPVYPVDHQLVHEFITNDYGDGFFQLISAEAAYTRSGGTGTVASYRGLNKFTIQFSKAQVGAGKLANELWLFFRDRCDNMNEPFYFYNPSERIPPDPTGADPIGRYLVRLAEPNEAMMRSFFNFCMYSYTGIALIEERA